MKLEELIKIVKNNGLNIDKVNNDYEIYDSIQNDILFNMDVGNSYIELFCFRIILERGSDDYHLIAYNSGRNFINVKLDDISMIDFN